LAGIGINSVTESVRIAAGGKRVAAAAPRIAEFAFAALAAFLLARLALTLFAPLPTPEGDALAAATSGAPKPQATVAARNPFPQVAIAAAPVNAAPDVAETSLDLLLTGVWPGENGSAIIRKPDGTQKRFAIGDTIVSGVTLAAVYSDQVLIEQNGVREALRFETKTAPQTPAQAAPSAPAGVSPANSATNAGASLTQFLRLAPARDASGAPAIAIYGGLNRRAFDRAGLEDGDILKTVNGAPPPLTPNELAALVTQISRVGSASLVVERGGATRQVTLSLNESGNE
jgi:general secretion pathway protein C